MDGVIFNIQRYSLHDGGGIRTMFFLKGCPLRCPWCSNPESQSFQPQITKSRLQCHGCTICAGRPEDCPTGALVRHGRTMTIDEVLRAGLKDEVFYHTSGGGITLSGGEVLAQSAFAGTVLREFQNAGIHTAVETSGADSWEDIVRVARYTDLILYDLKIMDRKKSKTVIGIDSLIILEHLIRLLHQGYAVIPRIPLIPGYTLTQDNITALAGFLEQWNVPLIHLLPFHQYGSAKYDALGKPYLLRDVAVPAAKDIEAVKDYMAERGITAVIGGT